MHKSGRIQEHDRHVHYEGHEVLPRDGCYIGQNGIANRVNCIHGHKMSFRTTNFGLLMVMASHEAAAIRILSLVPIICSSLISVR